MSKELLNYLLKTILNPWIIFGFIAQFVFFLRFAVQWYVSEKQKKSTIPNSFWYLSIIGTCMIMAYSIEQKDIVFTTASVLSMVIYIRNIALIRRDKRLINALTYKKQHGHFTDKKTNYKVQL